MPAVSVVYLQGNPIVSTIRQYRKRMISEIKTLAYLVRRCKLDPSLKAPGFKIYYLKG